MTPIQLGNKSREELLQLLSAYQRAIDVSIICSITDIKGKIVYANKPFCEACQYSIEELIGQSHNIINSGYHPQEFFKTMWSTIGNGGVWRGHVRNKAKDGSFYWVDTVVLPITNDEGKIIQYLSLRMLITEWKEAERKKEKYTHALEDMLRITSHQVRGPLMTCLGLLKLYEGRRQKGMSQEDMDTLFDHMKETAYHLDEFTRQLTTFIYDLIDQKKPD